MPSRLSYVWLSLKRGLGSRTAAEVLDAFGSPEAVFAADRQALTAAPCELRKTHVDLRGANARRLVQLGLETDNIDVSDECTMCLPEKYWSHRATDGVRGSMAAAIVL